MLCLFCMCGGAAIAAPGDEWVFGADAPVAAERTYSQYRPVASGDLVFWEDNRPGAGSQTFTRIFYRDLGDPDGTELPLTPGAGYFTNLKKGQTDPSASGTLVAWQEAVPSATGSRAYEIRYIEFGGGCLGRGDCEVLRVPRVSVSGLHPVVSGPMIVWQDDTAGAEESDIYMFDTRTGVIAAVCSEPGLQQDPDIDGEWVAWIDNRDGEVIRGRATSNDLYIKNIVTGEERKVTNDGDGGLQESPSISGDNVVFSENRGEDTRGDIMAYQISSGTSRVLYAGEGFDQRPAIDGDLIAWEACPGGISTCGIWIHDLTTGVSQPLSDGPRDGTGLNTSSAGLPSVAASSGRVVWQDSRGSARAIYENQLGNRAQVLAERHRPELRLGTDEHFEPEPFQLMLELPGSFLRRQPGSGFEPVRNPAAEDLNGKCDAADCYVDLMGSAVEAGGGETSCSIDRGLIARTYLDFYREGGDGFEPTVYARVKALPDGTVIQYWINYPVNDHPRLFHEGDWEMVQVRLDGALQPFRAEYSQHEAGQWREWSDVEKVDGSERPVVYVAAGSHASYFRPGEFELVPYLAWDFADGNGSALSPQVKVIPELEQAGETFSWLAFSGRWGEQTDAALCLPEIPGVFSPTGHRDGPPGPAFQGVKWSDPANWLAAEKCDGCEGGTGMGAVLGVTARVGADIHMYDQSGRHLGRDEAGGFEQEIPGAELFEYPGSGLLVLQAPGAGAGDIYRIEIIGAPAGVITITVPDHAAGSVDTLTYEPYTAEAGTVARLVLDQSRNYALSVDIEADGIEDFSVPPASIDSRPVDFLAPATINDLQARAVDTGAATLEFTAPGDDGAEGTVTAYDIRYSMMPIDAAGWSRATPFTSPLPPAPAGIAETITVDGLIAGTTYYFAVRAIDDTARYGALSNQAVTTTPAPALAWYQQGAYWGSYADYRERSLTVEYMMRNKGTATAIDAKVEASSGIPSACYAITPLPISVGDIEPESGRMVNIKYHVSDNASSFVATTHASCRDAEGGEHWFPEPLLQTIR